MVLPRPHDPVVARPEGLYCPLGDFYIDPWRAVDRAVITHAHSDPARVGHRHCLAQTDSAGTSRTGLGAGINLQTVVYGEVIGRHGGRFSLHPAGHVPGSARAWLGHGGQVWVASNDCETVCGDDDGADPVVCA